MSFALTSIAVLSLPLQSGVVHLQSMEWQSLIELMSSVQLNYKVSCEHQRDSDIINTTAIWDAAIVGN